MESNEFKLDYLPRFPQNRAITIGCIGSGFIMADCHLVAYRQAGFNPVAITSATSVNMRAIPHWMDWQERLGWATLRTMSIHHLDCFRFLFGDPDRVYCSVTQDPRTGKKFHHHDGVSLYILEYNNGFRASAWDDVWTGPS